MVFVGLMHAHENPIEQCCWSWSGLHPRKLWLEAPGIHLETGPPSIWGPAEGCLLMLLSVKSPSNSISSQEFLSPTVENIMCWKSVPTGFLKLARAGRLPPRQYTLFLLPAGLSLWQNIDSPFWR